MLEDYMKKIESLISPNHYSRTNYKDKISTEPIEEELYYLTKTVKTEEQIADSPHLQEDTDPNPQYTQSNIIKQNKKEQLLKKRNETEGQLEAPEEINKVHSSKSVQNSLQSSKKFFNSKAYDGDVKSLLEKIHNLNLKNMTYRNDIEKYKKTINELNQDITNQKITIDKLEHQKDANNQYLLKLEGLLTSSKQCPITSPIYNTINTISQKQNDLPIAISRQSANNEQSEQNSVKGNISMFTESNFSVDVNKNNLILIDDKKNKEQFSLSSPNEIKEFVRKLYKENQKLKIFQKHVYEISKSYDDINDNLLESIRNIQQAIQLKDSMNDTEAELLNNYQKLVNSVNATLQTKQNEYNVLLDEKDEQIRLIKEEMLILTNEIDERKKDRTKEIQIITTLEEEVKELKERLGESENVSKGIKGGFIERAKKSPMMKIDKRIEPAKNTLTNIVKKIETNLDMKDKNNAKMLGALSKVVR